MSNSELRRWWWILTFVFACAGIGHPGAPFDEDDDFGEIDVPSLPDGVTPAWQGEPDRDTPWTEPGELPRLLAPDGAALPLRNTEVEANVRGHVADVVVTQRFVNDRDAPIEVVYTFPLPENAAVWALRMRIGDRVIEGEIRTREQARQLYEAASAAGHTAALLEQERPNVFTQSIANVDGGAEIEVEVHYLQTLSFDAGSYEFVFPMVVAPRYLPGVPSAGVPSGTGMAPDTDRVPDASRVSPPLAGPGVRTGQDIAIAVDIEAGGEIESFAATTHAIVADHDGARLEVDLARADELPNRDFVLRWRPAGDHVRSTLFVGPTDAAGNGYFELLVIPPALDVDHMIGRREFVFVLDISGSMSGEPLALEKRLLGGALAALRPVDTFDVVTFESGVQRLFTAPQPANEARLAEALAFVSGLRAGGGTELQAGVTAALGDTVGAGRNRYVVFMTDGQIGDEDAIFAAAYRLVERQAAQHRVARVFAVGVGPSTNRHLIAGLARAGAGVPMTVVGRDDPRRALTRIQRVVDAAILTDLEIDWAGADVDVDAMFPSEVPALFATHAVVVHGRYRGAMPQRGVVLRARAGKRKVEVPVRVVSSAEGDATLGRLWARAQIAEIEADMWGDDQPGAIARIEALGLEHHLVTPYTSLIAIDRTRVVAESATTIVQPSHQPEGTIVTGVGVSLAGATATEAKYSLAGANLDSARFARMPTSHARSYAMVPVQEYLSGDRSSGSWRDAEPSLSVAHVGGGDRPTRARVRRALRPRRSALRQCLRTQDGRAGLDVDLHVVLRRGVAPQVTLDDSRLPVDVQLCVVGVIGRADWRTVVDGSYRVRLRWSGP